MTAALNVHESPKCSCPLGNWGGGT